MHASTSQITRAGGAGSFAPPVAGTVPARVILRNELPLAVEIALLACAAQSQGRTDYTAMRSAALTSFCGAL